MKAEGVIALPVVNVPLVGIIIGRWLVKDIKTISRKKSDK